jgi:hypothetical protein
VLMLESKCISVYSWINRHIYAYFWIMHNLLCYGSHLNVEVWFRCCFAKI